MAGGSLISPGIYRRLYRAGYTAIKSVASSAEVLLGETCPCGSSSGSIEPEVFVTKLFCGLPAGRSNPACAPLSADGFAHHPYQQPAPPERPSNPERLGIGSLDRLTTLVDRLTASGALVGPAGQPLPIYLTEFGYRVDGGVPNLPEPTRASYLPRAFDVAYRNPRVKEMVHYQLLSSGSSTWDTGIVALDGRPGSAFNALRAWSRRIRLAQARGSGRPDAPPSNPTGGTPAE
jgi:hypothetical protein